jgi:hypothetical protein
MSDDNDSEGESPPEQDEGYAVGWGKPPRHTQFKKGQSGNPKGRPPGSKNMNTLLAKALDEQVTARHKGKLKKFAMREAIPRQLVNKAASGDLKAIQLLFVLMPKVEASSVQQQRRAPEIPTDKSYWCAVLNILHECGSLDHAFDDAPPLMKQALANADWERIEELAKQWPPKASSKEQ